VTSARFVLVACFVAGVAPAAPAGAAAPPKAAPKPPAAHEESYVYDVFYQSIARPVARTLDPARLGRRFAGQPREAANVDERDEVRLPSTWWQPRIGYRPVTAAQVGRGPGPGTGPAPGRWTVTHAKTQGVTPGFQIKDSRGAHFLVKFDAAAHPELVTAADAISSRIFWAAGYNTPDNAIAWFRIADLDIDPKAKVIDARGHERPMTRDLIAKSLENCAREPDGRYRCITSRYLDGKPLGPFHYSGRRRDDPEDLVPHELRRELRGLWTLCAWTNHADSRSANSLDMWVTDGGRSFVRHHLIDFGATLGAGANGPKQLVTGTEYYVDALVAARQAATFGLAPFAWESIDEPGLPAVGTFDERTFDPVEWRPDYPNPAFDDRTDRDVRWGARIVAAFTDDDLRAAVAAGQYSDPRAARRVLEVLIARRDAIARRWLGSEPPPLRADR